jgi:hypothetical protein
MCTSLVVMDPAGKDASASPKEVGVTVWTAKHCVLESDTVAVTLRLSTKNVDGASGYVRMPIKLAAIDQVQALRAGLEKSPDVYGRFAEAYRKYSKRNSALIEPAGADGKSYVPEFGTGNLTLDKRAVISETLAFGSGLCNDPRKMDTGGLQKFCFTHDDLGAYRGTLILKSYRSEGFEDVAKDDSFLARAVVVAGNQQNNERARFESELGSSKAFSEAADKFNDTLDNKNVNANIVESWSRLFQNEHDLTAKLAYAEICGTGCAQRDAFVAAFGKDLIASAEQDKLDSLLADLGQEMDEKSYNWHIIGRNFLTKHIDEIYYQTNNNFSGVGGGDAGGTMAFQAVPFHSVAESAGTPLLWRPYGLVFWGRANGNFSIFESDSGATISIGGVFPIAAVSSLNNKPTSGGITIASIPQYRTVASLEKNQDNVAGGGPVGQFPEGYGSEVNPPGGQIVQNRPTGNGLPGSSETSTTANNGAPRSGSGGGIVGGGQGTALPTAQPAPTGVKTESSGDAEIDSGTSAGCT